MLRPKCSAFRAKALKVRWWGKGLVGEWRRMGWMKGAIRIRHEAAAGYCQARNCTSINLDVFSNHTYSMEFKTTYDIDPLGTSHPISGTRHCNPLSFPREAYPSQNARVFYSIKTLDELIRENTHLSLQSMSGRPKPTSVKSLIFIPRPVIIALTPMSRWRLWLPVTCWRRRTIVALSSSWGRHVYCRRCRRALGRATPASSPSGSWSRRRSRRRRRRICAGGWGIHCCWRGS